MKKLRWEAALVGVVALAATLAATERTPLTWDEGDAFVRAERVAAWTRAVVVGPQKLTETLDSSDVKPEKSTQIPPLNAEVGEKGGRGEEGERRERLEQSERPERPEQSERPRFGEVERAALEYFSRFDGRRALFSERAIEAGWPHVVYREGHPAGYSIAIASGRAFALRFLPFLSEKAAFRLGPILLFALALAAVFYRVARNWGRFAAILAVVGIATIPRVFGHAQLAGGDSLLISSWLLAWAFFDAALASKRGAVVLGAAVGVSFCAKFSGFAVVAPLTAGAVVALWSRRRGKTRVLEKTSEIGAWEKEGERGNVSDASGTRRDGVGATTGRLALAAAVATAVFFATNPPLWARPFAGFETFVSLNLRRDGFDIPIYFLGQIYSPSRPLPCWNGFFWLATTVPAALLAFAAFGTVAAALPKNRKNKAGGVNGEVGVNGENEMTAEITQAAQATGMTQTAQAARLAQTAQAENDRAGTVEANARNGGEGPGRFAAGLALAFAATLPIVRFLPGIPTHDGARLLIASFPFIAILAAFGATVFVERCGEIGRLGKISETGERIGRIGRNRRNGARNKGKRTARTARRLAQTLVAAAFALGVVDLLRSAPQYLSFYNAALGGVVGAQRRGMEATYYWDAFDGETVAWLNAKISAARADGRPSGVLFGSFSSQTLDYYRRWGTLATPEIATISDSSAFVNGGRFGFYVVQRRPSGWTTLDLALFKTARPIYRKTLRNPFDFRAENAVRREAVLLEIYDFADVERVLTGAARSPKEEKTATAR